MQFCSPEQLKPKPAAKDLIFGQNFTDHMLEIEWTEAEGWGRPLISPFHYFQMHPAAKVLHYAVEVREHWDTRTAEEPIVSSFFFGFVFLKEFRFTQELRCYHTIEKMCSCSWKIKAKGFCSDACKPRRLINSYESYTSLWKITLLYL